MAQKKISGYVIFMKDVLGKVLQAQYDIFFNAGLWGEQDGTKMCDQGGLKKIKYTAC